MSLKSQPHNQPLLNAEETSNLHRRWQAIRLQEINRQLTYMSDHRLIFVTNKAYLDAKAIYMPPIILDLPIEVVALISALKWGKKIHLSAGDGTPQSSELINFAYQFLIRYNYSLNRIKQYLSKDRECRALQSLSVAGKYLNPFLAILQTLNFPDRAFPKRKPLKFSAKNRAAPYTS